MIFYKKEKIAFRKEIEMNLNQLHYFSKLAEVEHYTKAAEELKVSQPSLSHAKARCYHTEGASALL